MITVTPKAGPKLREALNATEFRLAVTGGGCSGLQYGFVSLADAPQQESDQVFESNGLRIVVDRISIRYLDGSEIDWQDDALGGRPYFLNPNSKGTCGCGMSFDPKE